MSNIAHFSTNWTQWDIKTKQKKYIKLGEGCVERSSLGKSGVGKWKIVIIKIHCIYV